MFVAAAGPGRSRELEIVRPPEHTAAIEALLREQRAQFAGNGNVLVRPGLLANRETKTVSLLARMTSVTGLDAVEFFLIAEHSAHDYEALAVSYASPTDVYEALLFIGMEPGLPYQPGNRRFWAKGERVIMHVAPHERDGSREPVRAERLILDKRTGEPLPPTGFVFCGARIAVPDSDKDAAKAVPRAEVRAPNALASAYNEPNTILDVPRRAPQSAVYDFHAGNAELLFPEGTLLNVVLEPERPAGPDRVKDLSLTVARRQEAGNEGLAALSLSLRDRGAGVALIEEGGLNDVLKTFTELIDDGRDPFVSLSARDDVPVGALHDLYALLSAVETDHGIRVEPPPPGQLYYQAFLPDPSYRDRDKRYSQPWELRLQPRPDGAVTGLLTQVREVWKDGLQKPELNLREFAVSTPEALRRTLDSEGPGLPVILVFAPPELLHGDLMRFLTPVLPTHDTVYVLLETGSGKAEDTR